MLDAEVVSSDIGKGGLSHRIIYAPIIRYRYRHDNADYVGKRAIFAGIPLSTRSQKDAEQFIAPFLPGVQVWTRSVD